MAISLAFPRWRVKSARRQFTITFRPPRSAAFLIAESKVMAIAVQCGCGQQYQLKDELAGKLVKCPACGDSLRVAEVERAAQADPAFDHDKFLLRQKIGLNEKYHVWNEQGDVLLFIERRVHLLRTIGAIFAAVLVVILVGAASIAGVAAVASMQQQLGQDATAIAIAVITAGGVISGLIAVVAVLIWIAPKRHVRFYRDETRREQLLEVQQDKKVAFITATYTVVDRDGNLLARLQKNYLYNLIRKRWLCLLPDGAILCVAREDSIILSLLRRLLGPMLGLLRTNFVIHAGESDRVIGEFNRKFTLLDRYVLDLSADRQRALDRRIAVALGVMLDTGERR
jgi:uncharacterized protein YxjI